MTLADFYFLLKPKAVLAVVTSLLAALVFFGGSFLLVKNTYCATGAIATNGNLAVVKGAAGSIASNSSEDGISFSVTSDNASNSVSIAATSSDPNAAVSAVNTILSEVQNSSIFAESETRLIISQASGASNVTPNRAKYAAAFFVFLLFVWVVVLVLADMRNRKIYSWESLQAAVDYPYVGTISDDLARRERLRVAIYYLDDNASDEGKSVCLIPAGNVETASKTAEILRLGKAFKNVDVVVTEPLAKGSEALRRARGKDAVLLCVCQGLSSYSDVEDAARELKLVGVEVDGFIFERR